MLLAPKEHRIDTPAGAESPASGFSFWSSSKRCRGEAPLSPLTSSPWAQSPLTLLLTTQHPCCKARGAHLPEAHLCLEPEQGQNRDQGDFRASCLPFPMPVPPWLQVCLQSPLATLVSPCPLASQGRPGVTVVGLPAPASVALPFQPLLWPCRLHRAGMEVSGHRRAGSWSRTQAFKCPSWVGGAAAGQGGCGQEDHWSPETGGGLGSVQTHGAGAGAPGWEWLVPPRGTWGCGKSRASRNLGFQIQFCCSVPRACCWGW